MGLIFSRKKRSSLQELEKIEEKIQSIESCRQFTELRQRRIISQLVGYSITLYILVAAVFYFYYFPTSLQRRLLYTVPLIGFPFLIFLVKRIVTWYYHSQLARNQEHLSDLRQAKKKILDDVMDKETYKVAWEILEKFAPEQLRKQTGGSNTPMTPSKNLLPLLKAGGSELRHRVPSQSTAMAVKTPLPPPSTPAPSQPQNTALVLNHRRLPMVRPILPQDRGYMDKIVEYLVGDGPSNRFALICRACCGHNGMALKEEFEYIAFRCCYCTCINPARKQRPHPPRLGSPQRGSLTPSEHSTESESDTTEPDGPLHPFNEESVLEKQPVPSLNPITESDLTELDDPLNPFSEGYALEEQPVPPLNPFMESDLTELDDPLNPFSEGYALEEQPVPPLNPFTESDISEPDEPLNPFSEETVLKEQPVPSLNSLTDNTNDASGIPLVILAERSKKVKKEKVEVSEVANIPD